MSRMHALRKRLVEGPNSLGERSRSRRWKWFAETFPDIEQMSVVDLGGTAEAWVRAPVRPKSVHVINLEPSPGAYPAWVEFDLADACKLPERLRGRGYDLVFSNSVIEHVGGHMRREQFAETIHALSDRHWVQTPYRYFPVEPHWLCPGMQFLPLAGRAQVARRWPLAHTPTRDPERALRNVLQVELLSCTEMRHCFPDSEIRFDRVAGLVKSLVAVKAA
jgi:hypothetical protein